MNKASGNMETVYQTEAQWTADDRVFSADVVAVTTDGANAGKHKLFKGTGRWSTLSYVEDPNAGGNASVYLDGVVQSGIYTKVVNTVNGQVTIDWTAHTPALASVRLVSVVVENGFTISYNLGSSLVNNFILQMYDLQTLEPITTSDIPVTVTVVGIEA